MRLYLLSRVSTFMKNSTQRILLVSIVLILLLSAGYGARALLTSVSTKHLNHAGTQAVHPLRVELSGLSRAAASRSAVTRISPRGNETSIEHRFADGGTSWHIPNEYVTALRVYLSGSAQNQLQGVRIEMGRQHILTDHPAGSDLWEPVPADDSALPPDLDSFVAPDAAVFELSPEVFDSAWTVLPTLSRVFNYVGDLRLAVWSFLWALFVVAPVSCAALVRRNGAPLKEAPVVSSFVVAVAVLIVAATVFRFVNPPGATAGYVKPMALAGRALSLSLLILLVSRAHERHLASPMTRGSSFYRSHRVEILIVTLITAVGLLLRLVNLPALMRSDMYNLAAALSLHDSGSFSYLRNLDLTRTVAGLMDVLGRSISVSKIPFVAAGTLTIPLVYLLGRFVSPMLGVAAAVLFALGPNHIAMTAHVREYTVNLLIGSVLALVEFGLYKRFADRRLLFVPLFVGTLAVLFSLVLIYSNAVNNVTVLAVLQSGAFLAVPLVLHYISRHFPRLTRPLLIAAGVVFVVGFIVVHRFGPFTSGLILETDYLLSYLNPLAGKTMQTFSHAAVSPLFVVGLMVLPFITGKRSPYMDAALLAFWGTMILYVLKLDEGGSDRYLYHVTVLHALLLAGGLLWLYRALCRTVPWRLAGRIGAILLLLVIVNPVNSVQSAFGLVPNAQDTRRPVGPAGGDYYRDVAAFMRNQGLTQESAVIEATSRPYLASLALDRRFTRRWHSSRGPSYDVGEGIYVMRPIKHEVDQSAEAFAEHQSGFLISDKYRMVPPKDFRLGDVDFSYQGSLPHPNGRGSGFVLHRWEVEGPDRPALGDLFRPTNEVRSGLTRGDLF